MAVSAFQSLPGFRDFLPRDFAVRQYLHETWRATARRHGFVEYETPLLEDTELYLKKSGGELSTQLFRFEDQGGRDITLRPEVTASLARLAADHQRHFPKPLKWFEIGQCFRYEKPQKGRGREFFQFNVDLLGESSAVADAELLSVAIDTMRAFGFAKEDYQVRVSDRQAWANFANQRGLDSEQLAQFLQIVDKLERDKAEVLESKLAALGLTLTEVQAFIADPANASESYRILLADLAARGLAEFVRWDLSIVRGLAYYTGLVFEVFDAKNSMRAVAGGGRYDTLISTISDGKVDLPATGFAMGDYVIRNLIEETPHALMQMEVWLQRHQAGCDVYVVVDREEHRADALRLITSLRTAGVAVDYALTSAKLGKQLQRAEQSGARLALIVGEDASRYTAKILSSRSETSFAANDVVEAVVEFLQGPDGPLLA
ncbi:MAG: histidine--tRNA ligase [Verrucomicrobia bacterium]|nr:MAG: histidine--tRNA ligase [Verrucomicrobiota bacterium]